MACIPFHLVIAVIFARAGGGRCRGGMGVVFFCLMSSFSELKVLTSFFFEGFAVGGCSVEAYIPVR